MGKVLCILCGGEIQDAAILEARYGTTPKVCEPCRAKSRPHREPKIPAWHRLIDQAVCRVQWSYITLHGPNEGPDGRQYWRGKIGGRMYGPWGGASHGGGYVVISYVPPGSAEPVLARLMVKQAAETVERWKYVVLEPAPSEVVPEGEELPVLAVHFTRIYKTTLKGFGRQFDRKRSAPGIVLKAWLSGWSSSRSGRFGNEWQLVLYVPAAEEVNVEGEPAD